MLHRIETRDPITGRDVQDLSNKPYVVTGNQKNDLIIYFESEETKQQYLAIAIERPIEHRINLDNPTDHMVPEG